MARGLRSVRVEWTFALAHRRLPADAARKGALESGSILWRNEMSLDGAEWMLVEDS